MENENIVDAPASFQNSPLTVSPQATAYLSETGKWSRFLAILGFCFVGLAVLGGLFAGTFLSRIAGQQNTPFPTYYFGVIYVFMGAIYFFPIYYLFKFSTHVKAALASRDSRELDKALEYLKSHYKYIGILFIILLAFYVFFGVGALVVSSLMHG